MTTKLKIICAAMLIAAWGACVVAGLAPAEPFVAALRGTLVTLGIF